MHTPHAYTPVQIQFSSQSSAQGRGGFRNGRSWGVQQKKRPAKCNAYPHKSYVHYKGISYRQSWNCVDQLHCWSANWKRFFLRIVLYCISPWEKAERYQTSVAPSNIFSQWQKVSSSWRACERWQLEMRHCDKPIDHSASYPFWRETSFFCLQNVALHTDIVLSRGAVRQQGHLHDSCTVLYYVNNSWFTDLSRKYNLLTNDCRSLGVFRLFGRIHRVTVMSFLHSYLCQLFWPPWCRNCKHFSALTVSSPIWR